MGVKNPNLHLACDIDLTLIAGQDKKERQFRPMAERALKHLRGHVQARRHNHPDAHTYFGAESGRTLADQAALEGSDDAYRRTASIMDFKIGSVGAEMVIQDEQGFFHPAASWPPVANWNRHTMYEHLTKATRPRELQLQEPIAQSTYKLSFYVNAPEYDHQSYVNRIKTILAQRSLRATVVFSGGRYLDLLPVQPNGMLIHKGTAYEHNIRLFAERDNLNELPTPVAAGDSKNDCDMLQTATQLGGYALLPGNITPEMRKWAGVHLPARRHHIATAPYAAGIAEGLHRFELLD